MTEFNNKFIPNTPKTYEVRYLENQEQQELTKTPIHLGIKTVYCNPQDNGSSGSSGSGGGSSGSSGSGSAHTVHVDVNKEASNYASDQSYQLRSEGRDGGCNILL